MASRRLQAPVTDPLTLLAVDPDARPGVLDGLLVDGQDPLAGRRKLMRERISGPDPAPEVARMEKPMIPLARETSPVRLTSAQRSGATMLRPEERSAPPPEPHEGPQRLAPLRFEIITREQFAALTWRAQSAVDPIVEALERGHCVRIATSSPRERAALRQALRKRAHQRGLTLELKSGPDWVAARIAEDQVAP